MSVAPDFEDHLFEKGSHELFHNSWKVLGIFDGGHYEHYATVPIADLSTRSDAAASGPAAPVDGSLAEGFRPKRAWYGRWLNHSSPAAADLAVRVFVMSSRPGRRPGRDHRQILDVRSLFHIPLPSR